MFTSAPVYDKRARNATASAEDDGRLGRNPTGGRQVRRAWKATSTASCIGKRDAPRRGVVSGAGQWVAAGGPAMSAEVTGGRAPLAVEAASRRGQHACARGTFIYDAKSIDGVSE